MVGAAFAAGCSTVIIEPVDGGGGQGGEELELYSLVFDSEREGLPAGIVISTIPPQCGGLLTTTEDVCPDGVLFEMWFPPELLVPGRFPVDRTDVYSRFTMLPQYWPEQEEPYCGLGSIQTGQVTIDSVTETEVVLRLSQYYGELTPEVNGTYVIPRCKEPLQ